MLNKTAAIGAILAAAAASNVAEPAFAADPIANAGTLTCTLSPSEKLAPGTQTRAAVSCRFTAVSGEEVNMSGQMVRMATATERDTKIVIAWSVLAPTPDLPPHALSGKYTGKFAADDSNVSGGTQPSGTLFGTGATPVELRPLNSPAEQSLPAAGLTILELEIAQVKV